MKTNDEPKPFRVKKGEVEEPKSKPPKTFLVSYCVATVGSHVRENFSLGLVEAQDIVAAEDCAWQLHYPEGFDEDDKGQWIGDGKQRAFQLSSDAPDVDANCILSLDEITEVPAADVAVLSKYIPLSRVKPAAETR